MKRVKIEILCDTCKWKKGDIVELNAQLAETLVESLGIAKYV